MSVSSHHVVALSGKHFNQLKRHLFPGDGLEAVAIALCGRGDSARQHLMTVMEIFDVPYAVCRARTPDRVTWSVETILPVLDKAMKRGLTVVKFHSHPGGFAEFSSFDDESDATLFAAINGYLDTDSFQASAVMLPNGRLFGRVIRRGNLGQGIDEFRVAGDDFIFWRREDNTADELEVPEHALRIIQAFGEGTYRSLRKLRIGVVGCSGTGSIVIEQLARNCVGELVLVDPEPVEHKNLNRVLNSTFRDAEGKSSKVQVAERAIAAMGLRTRVMTYENNIFSREVVTALGECDVLFGCVDSVDGRHILNKIATQFVIPLIDIGVRIDADGKGGVEQVCGAVHTIQPGGSSLMSRQVYSVEDLNAAFMKAREPKRYSDMLKIGYVRGVRVDQPAVISLNMQIAATAVNEFIARLNKFRNESNSMFAQRRILLTDPAASFDEDDGAPCQSFSKWVGLAAKEPLLGYPELQ